MNMSLMYFHVTSVDLSMSHCVSEKIGMVGFVTSTTTSVISYEASLEAS